MRSIMLAAVAAVSLALTACGSTENAVAAADSATAIAERATALVPRSGDAKSEKSLVDPSTAVAAAMGATAIAAPAKAFKDGQNSATGFVQTGFMLGGATDSQMAFVNHLIESDKSLQSIGEQLDTLLAAWSLEGGQTPERADMLVALRGQYEKRFDQLAKVGEGALPARVDLSKLTTIGVFNWSSGYVVGNEQKPMSADEARAAAAAAVAQWQGITAISTQNGQATVDGGNPLPDAGESEGADQ